MHIFEYLYVLSYATLCIFINSNEEGGWCSDENIFVYTMRRGCFVLFIYYKQKKAKTKNSTIDDVLKL